MGDKNLTESDHDVNVVHILVFKVVVEANANIFASFNCLFLKNVNYRVVLPMLISSVQGENLPKIGKIDIFSSFSG